MEKQDFIFIQHELTYNCNASCFFCYNSRSSVNSENSSISTFYIDRVFQNLSSVRMIAESIHLQFIGGEVTTLSNLEDILNKARKIFPDFTLSIVTNGLLLREFLPLYVDQIYIAIHSVNKFSYYFGEGADFSIWKKNTSFYVKHIDDVFFDVTVFPTMDSINGLKDIASLAVSMGVNTIFVNIFQPEGRGRERANMTFTLTYFKKLIDVIIDIQEKFKIEILFGTSTPYCLDDRLISEGLKFSCGAGEWHFVIAPNGDVKICNQSNKVFGSLLKEDFARIKERIDKVISKVYSEFSYLPQACRNCEFLLECKGGCRIGYNEFFRPDPMLKNLPQEEVT